MASAQAASSRQNAPCILLNGHPGAHVLQRLGHRVRCAGRGDISSSGCSATGHRRGAQHVVTHATRDPFMYVSAERGFLPSPDPLPRQVRAHAGVLPSRTARGVGVDHSDRLQVCTHTSAHDRRSVKGSWQQPRVLPTVPVSPASGAVTWPRCLHTGAANHKDAKTFVLFCGHCSKRLQLVMRCVPLLAFDLHQAWPSASRTPRVAPQRPFVPQ